MMYGYENAMQLSVALKSVGFGYICGFCYSVFSVMKFAGDNTLIADIIRDLLFFVFISFLSYMFFLKYNAGFFRFYILACQISGYLIYEIFPGGHIREKINSVNLKK